MIPSFTCVLRCHMVYPKFKVRNLISSNSVAGAYILALLLANPNLHRLLKPVKLPTPVLLKRISLIFLWEDFSQRDTIPIVNALLYKFYIFVVWWCAHSYLALLKNNKETDCFRNRLLYFCLLVHNVMTNWKKIKEQIMSIFHIWFLIYIDMCFFLSDDQQIANEGWFCRSKSKYEWYVILWLNQKTVTGNTKKAQI